MKILLASDAYIYQTNGVANVVIALERGLSERGHDVKVLATSCDNQSRREGRGYLIRSRKSTFYPDIRVSLARRDPLLSELEAWQPDLIHLHTEASMARLAYRLTDRTHAPLVMTAHTDYAHFLFGERRNKKSVQLLLRLWGKAVYRRCAAVVAPSEKARDFVQLSAVRDRVQVIPNGIPLERYQRPVPPEERAAVFQRCGLTDNGCTLVMVTRVSQEKNIDEVLRYFPALLQRVPQAQLIIAGDGPERHKLEALSRDMGLERVVRFAGRIPPEEVYRIYAAGDAFVSASTFEVHSLTNLEAMAQGLPLICRADASLLGVLENGVNGFAYETEEGFVTAAQRVLQDAPLRERLRQGALARAREFGEERFLDRTLALYQQLVKG